MPITPQELGRRIRAAREACGLTQAEAADHLGVSRPAFVQIEAGKRSVSSLELDRLALRFGRDIRAFVADTFRAPDVLTALFRAEPAAEIEPGVLDRVRDCIALGRELAGLERLIGIDRDPSAVAAAYPLPTPKSRAEAVQQGLRLAEDERRRLGLGFAPLPEETELLAAQGIRTGLVDLPDDVSGLTLVDPDSGVFVVVNKVHPRVRRRFSFAHEYAHVVADRDGSGRISRTSARNDLVEVRANAFAAEFLMPADGVRRFVAGLGKGRPSRSHGEVFDEVDHLSVEGRSEPGTQTIQLYDVVQLAGHFGVSRLSTLFRLRNLRLITEAEFDRLKAMDDQGAGKRLEGLLGLDEPEPHPARDVLKQRFLGIALEAFRRDEISRGKFRELGVMAHLTADDVDQLLAAGVDRDAAVS